MGAIDVLNSASSHSFRNQLRWHFITFTFEPRHETEMIVVYMQIDAQISCSSSRAPNQRL